MVKSIIASSMIYYSLAWYTVQSIITSYMIYNFVPGLMMDNSSAAEVWSKFE
jgi:hypothetical protein